VPGGRSPRRRRRLTAIFDVPVDECDKIAAIPYRSGWRAIARALGYTKEERQWLLGWRHATVEHRRWKVAYDRGLQLGRTPAQMGASVEPPAG
jgi:hypothetical protein